MPRTKKKVRNLLKAGKGFEEIGKQLSLTQNEVKKCYTKIIEDRIKWNQKEPLLKTHQQLISRYIAQRMTVKQIYDNLVRKKIKTSYSAVWRFVYNLKRKTVQSSLCQTPGAEAVVYFVRLGNFIKDGCKVTVWMFCLRLLYSQYCYHTLVTDNSMDTFLKCHARAFMALGGAPKRIIKICCRDNIIYDAKSLTRYNYFLYCCGSCYSPNDSKKCQVDCGEDIKFFRRRFVATVLHNDYYKLKGQVGKWITTVINLGMHPISRLIVKKQFLNYEKIKLNRVSQYTLKKAMK